jgi:glycosyltransferase involved in cell wall biosynthesis
LSLLRLHNLRRILKSVSIPKLICVIPAHNEAKQLAAGIEFLLRGQSAVEFEKIIISENGSSDDTLIAAENCRALHPERIIVLSHPEPDFGAALVNALVWLQKNQLSAEWLQFNGADIPFADSDLKAWVANPGFDFYLGSKFHPDSQVTRSFSRTLVSFIFLGLRRVILGLPYRDTQGTFFMLIKNLEKILPRLNSKGFMVSTEIVYWHHRLGYKICELPVCLKQDLRPSSVNIVRQCARMLIQLFKIKRP